MFKTVERGRGESFQTAPRSADTSSTKGFSNETTGVYWRMTEDCFDVRPNE